MNTEIAIIGGGASGLAAAALLSKKNIRSVLIERNARVGKKLLTTGNGRCNLGHTPLEISANYHGDVDLAQKVFADWEGAEKFFRRFGLICKADSQGRLYPYSNSANSVLDSLRNACEHTNFLLKSACESIVPEQGGFLINGLIHAKKLIWACGGFGADYSLLKKLGHSVVEPFPALCPIITEKSLTNPLKGLRVHALCKAVVNGTVIKSELGEVQFNENSLSGICIMNLSRLVREHGENLTISLDIAPDYPDLNSEELYGISPQGMFQSRIASVMMKGLGQIKDWRFPVRGVASAEKSQISAGGVPSSELNSDLSSKIFPNLHIIGEAVNVDGDCGGYNLEWAWASASTALRSSC